MESGRAGVGMSRTAGVLSWVLGVGFGLPGIYGAYHLATRQEQGTFLGFPTYGGGAFERIGIRTTVPLLSAFVVVCGAEVVVGILLWRRRRAGAVSSLMLLPLEFVFWIGFALPFGPALGIPRSVLAVLGQRRAS